MCLHKGWSGFRDFWEKGGGGGQIFPIKIEGEKIWKRGVGNIGSLQKIGGLALLCQLFEETLKISRPPL